jgi:3-deoxy-manno-octulosonate cytidylyltransferase (CMP-KDO synthetase)
LRPFSEAPETQVTTLRVPATHGEAAAPNAVKVVSDAKGRALYFSRATIPYLRDGPASGQHYKHLGFYAYTDGALEMFSRWPPSRLEELERLEQLRFLENGIPITVVETSQDTIGVDTEEDLKRVEAYFRRTGVRLPGT